MKNKGLRILVGLFAVIAISSNCFASDLTDQEVTPGAKKIYLEPQKSVLEKGEFKFLLGLSGGYDNNTYLDSRREGDAFFQTFFKASFIAPFSEKTKGTFDYEMMNLIYGDESDLDLIRNGIRLGMDHELSEELTFSPAFSFDSIEFLNTGTDDYLENELELKLRHKLPNKMYHSLTYDLSYRNYAKRYTRTSATVDTDKERNDMRNVVEYEIGKRFDKDLLKVSFQYFNNNSNENYLKYYDYDSYKIGGSLTHIFTNKISGYVSFFRQFRDYRSRTLINDASVTELEKTNLITTALFYNLNDAVSFGLSYTYRQNNSNEPADKYSGSLISLATYYKF